LVQWRDRIRPADPLNWLNETKPEKRRGLCFAFIPCYSSAIVAGSLASKAADGCISYSDEKTDFTWCLCLSTPDASPPAPKPSSASGALADFSL
jgi:hypothetical protein